MLNVNVLAVAAVMVQMYFIMNKHYRFSEAQAFGFSLQPSWRHIGLLAVVAFCSLFLSNLAVTSNFFYFLFNFILLFYFFFNGVFNFHS